MYNKTISIPDNKLKYFTKPISSPILFHLFARNNPNVFTFKKSLGCIGLSCADIWKSIGLESEFVKSCEIFR